MVVGGVEGMITFTYYNDLEKAAEFYGETMGFALMIDVDFAKVYRVSDSSHIGIVDGERGFLRAKEDKPVMISFVVEDIDVWYDYLRDKGVEIFQPPKEASYLRMKTLLLRDPEGYVVEILEFLEKPYGRSYDASEG
jgi:predicted enzyme related to lactoylglutathione lyase